MKTPLVLLLCLAPAVSWAEQPLVQPQRDVDVTYKVPVAGGKDMAMLQRLRFSATQHMQRLDLPTSGTWMVLDFNTHRMAMVRDDSREIVDVAAPENIGEPGAGAGFLRLGPARVADLPCTEWRTRDTRGQETEACYTDDGVLLRARDGDRVLMEAIAVHYDPQAASVFALPEGYTHEKGE